MGYGCIGCKRQFDKKGALRTHEGKCSQYKAETHSRRVNFIRTAEKTNAEPSGSGQANQISEEDHPPLEIEEPRPEQMEVRTLFYLHFV